MSLDAPSDDAAGIDPVPETRIAASAGDRCVVCAAPLQSDQRYCVVCGERRGAPRFSLPAPAAAPAPAASAPARSRRTPRLGQGPTLIAGVATLLLAMLVGVLIGHGIDDNQPRTLASAPVRIITTGGGVAAPAAAAATTPAHTAARGGSEHHAAHHAAPEVTRKTVAREQNAASKVLGGHSTPPPTVTVGSTGSGRGYNKKTHRFDGSFFGQ